MLGLVCHCVVVVLAACSADDQFTSQQQRMQRESYMRLEGTACWVLEAAQSLGRIKHLSFCWTFCIKAYFTFCRFLEEHQLGWRGWQNHICWVAWPEAIGTHVFFVTMRGESNMWAPLHSFKTVWSCRHQADQFSSRAQYAQHHLLPLLPVANKQGCHWQIADDQVTWHEPSSQIGKIKQSLRVIHKHRALLKMVWP